MTGQQEEGWSLASRARCIPPSALVVIGINVGEPFAQPQEHPDPSVLVTSDPDCRGGRSEIDADEPLGPRALDPDRHIKNDAAAERKVGLRPDK